MALPLIGAEFRVAAEPDLRFALSGKAVVRLRLVADSKKRDESGQWVDDKVLWITGTAFGDLAEHITDSIVKGDLVVVTGRLQTEEWSGQDGEKRSETRLLLDSCGASLRFRTMVHGERPESPRQDRQADRGRADTGARSQSPTDGGSGRQRAAQPSDDDAPPF